jgi:hypothetical protein
MVEERGSCLRQLPFIELKRMASHPIENVVVGSRKGTIALIILSLPSGGIQVVVQGFLKSRFMPGSSVACHGFYKYPDETISEMAAEEFWDFD